jgi:TnpA family transposase
MRWVGDERRLSKANAAVLTFTQQHPIAAAWGCDNLASSDMMSLETTRRVWQARLDPRRNTPSVGVYSHVSQRWSIFYSQPIVLNERQAGAALEGMVRQESLDPTQLAVDNHGYTDFAMLLAFLLGFDLCPRLKSLKERRLYIPRGWKVPAALKAICSAVLDLDDFPEHWDQLVNLAASVLNGTSAVAVMARFGACAKGDPLYDTGVQAGRLVRTAFLCEYWTNPAFRREILRILNRGESVNSLKRLIYAGRVSPHQARRPDEMQAVAEALNLLANILMAWNTAQMQTVLNRWVNRGQIILPELIGRIAPTHAEGINMRGTFLFPIERFAPILLPSQPAPIIAAAQ